MVFSHILDPSLRINEQSALAILDVLCKHPGAYVSCQDFAHLEINPNYSNAMTPRGLYGFPRDFLAYMVMWMTLDRTYLPTSGINYAHRENFFVFDLEGNIADSDTYDRSDLARDLEHLGEIWNPASRNVHDLGFNVDCAQCAETAGKWLTDTRKYTDCNRGEQFKYLILASEKIVDSMLPTTSNQGFREHPHKPALWQAVLASLGYTALVDRHALLTGDIEQQIVVVEPSAIRGLVCIANPIKDNIQSQSAYKTFP